MEKTEKLRSSILSKSPQNGRKTTSLNKFLKIVFRKIKPIMLSQTFWKILHESGKPVKLELFVPSEIPPAQSKEPTTTSKRSSIFAEAFTASEPKKRHDLLLPITNNR